MNKYGSAALKAIEYYSNSPVESWEMATLEIFGEKSSQKKGCPRNTFLGLCEEGLIKGIPEACYLKLPSNKNKQYAICAVQILKSRPQILLSPGELWNQLNLGDKSHNSQMDVVLALWSNNLINC